MIESLKTIEHQRVDLVEAKKTAAQTKIAAWQTFNIKLAALKSAAAALKDPDSFQAFSTSMVSDNSSVSASRLLSAAASTSAEPGSYTIKINSIARAEKISSASFSSSTEALGSGFSGGILINGHLVNIESTDDLIDVRNKINSSNTGTNPSGVTATILSFSADDVRLIITSGETGAEGITLANASANDVIGKLGLSQTGVRSNSALTSGGSAVTGATLIKDIDGYSDYASGDTIALTGKDASNATVNSTFTITDATTVQDLLDAIETAYAGTSTVTASLTADGKIQVADGSTTGTSSVRVELTPSKSTLDFGTFGTTGTTVAGADASLEIEGVEITRSGNTVDDVIEGVTLNLLAADGDTTITLNIERDTSSIVADINNLVDKYNEVASFIHEQQSYDSETQTTGGVLFGDGTLSSIQLDLTTAIIQQIAGVDGSYSILGQIGINLDNEGQLSVDSDVLSGFLETNFNDVRALFTSSGTPESGSLSYVSHTSDAAADVSAYSVYVTSPATRAASTSDNEVIGTLGSAETLTITEGSLSAAVSLTADMTLEQAKDAVNAALAAVSETLASSESLYSDAGHTTAITASTAWDSIYDSGGNSAGLADGSVISFTGTSRSGDTVSGSYEIGSAATDTVQGLLYAIEDAFDYEVEASIDSSGRLVITDKESGASDISLELTGLDYGTISASNTGGAEGRIALGVTATTDGNRLVLTEQTYGSGHSFDIAETGHLLWNTDTTVDNGADISGTINGEAATGSGRNLTYSGVTVQYTGSASGQNVGTVNLTIGLGELLDRALYDITDSIDGYLTFKLDSLQESVTGYTTQIEEMEDFIDRKMDNLTARFVRMETALSKMQTLSSWLTGQLSSLTDYSSISS
jgi:flagellar hook-associated protein 2